MSIDPGHYPKLIGARLRELCEARGLTCVALSRLARVGRQSVSATELGRGCCPTLNTLAQYALALNVDILDILSCLASPPAAVSASFAVADGIPGTSQPARSNPPDLAAARHLTLDAPFGLMTVDEFIAKLSEHAARTDVQTPGAVVGAASVCSDSRGRVSAVHSPDVTAAAVDLATWSPCS
jgi:transcriptional regulator with XRE-family HTH domain